MSGHGAKCTSHVFVGHGGQTEVKGKSRYPDNLILKLPVMDAWRIMNEVTAQLERCFNRSNAPCEITVALLGKLTESEEE